MCNKMAAVVSVLLLEARGGGMANADIGWKKGESVSCKYWHWWIKGSGPPIFGWHIFFQTLISNALNTGSRNTMDRLVLKYWQRNLFQFLQYVPVKRCLQLNFPHILTSVILITDGSSPTMEQFPCVIQ